MKLLLRHCFQRKKFIHTCIVHQDIQPPKRLLRLIEQTLHIGRFRNVSLHGYRLSAFFRDLFHYAIRTFLAGGVVHNN
jgi:hypothetical protein